MILNRDEVITGLARHIIDGMDMDTLLCYALQQLTSYFSDLSEEDLIAECDSAAFDIEVSV